MSKRYRKFVITFMDGKVINARGDRAIVNLGVLTISTEQPYGMPDAEIQHFPLHNVRMWDEEEDT